MKIRQLRSVIVLADVLNFTKAAERCNLGQPAFSRLVAELEDELHTRLFHRDKRHVTLTPEGAEFIAAARAALHELDNGVKRLHAKRPLPEFRVALEESAYGTLVVELLRAFRRRYPNVRVLPQSVHAEHGRAALLTGQVDLSVTTLPANLTDLHVASLVTEPLTVLVARDHRLAAQDVISTEDLAGETLLAIHTEHVDGLLPHLARAARAAHPDARIRWLGQREPTPGVHDIRRLVASGLGLHLNVGSAHPLPGKVVLRPLTGLDMHVELVAVWHLHSPNVDRFLDLVTAVRTDPPGHENTAASPPRFHDRPVTYPTRA
ncbi:LysR family transcriptional regulator [Deinococcus pimensis]|uniref:LysR family transcriptional regulator n=1 Tax=Deinococcus pimensis TaxID=309888 RepID=UPI000489D6A3|nr:LysR family transcriptional regulator [Deinococcus pimensis]